jgi:1,4-alpha-glucan branching enzyme
MKKDEYGVFEVTVPAVNGKPAIPHDSKLKVRLLLPSPAHN